MRYLKLASAKNPTNDFIELNDLYGFFCTYFQTLGIARKLEFLSIKNRQTIVENKPDFKKYNLTIEILSKYSEYELKYNELISFIDRNKNNGFRLYYRPDNNIDLRYVLCDIESLQKIEKRQPIVLVLTQNSLWLSEEKKVTTSQTEESGNLFEFKQDEDIENYYCASFYLDNEISNYYCIAFSQSITTQTEINNNSHNEIPLNIKIYGRCINPVVSLFIKGSNELIRKTRIFANINEGYYIEINANIFGNGVWRVNSSTGEKIDYTELVDNSFGSPYFYIDNGQYYISVSDDSGNACITDIFYQEEYS